MNTMKGQVDIIYLIVSLFAVVIVLFVVDIVWTGLTSNASFTGLTNQTVVGQQAVKNVNTSIGILNNAVVFLFIASMVASIILAAFVNTSIIFAIPAIIALPLDILFAFVFHDTFFQVIATSSFGAVANTYPYIVTLFTYLPVVTLGFAVVLIAVLFTKPQ